jgi:hypothetical protein
MHHHKVEYASEYLVPGVALPAGPSFHQVTLTWDRDHPGSVGQFHIDPNSCALDAFGDPTICTKMAVSARDMKLTLIAEKPGHLAYTIETRSLGSNEAFAALPLRLVTIAAHGTERPRARLLIVKPDHTVERIIELHEQRAA